MGMEDFHDRLCAFTSDCILARREWLASGRPYPAEEAPQRLEQGDLFGMEEGSKSAPPPKEPYSPPAHEKAEEAPKAMVQPPPEKRLTYADYLKIHCGNDAAANYWYMKNEGRPLV